jgi:hypothetical protein
MPVMPAVAILGSCVTRDAFELIPDQAQSGLAVATYVARTTIRSSLAAPVSWEARGSSAGGPRFEDRCVRSDVAKTHFRDLVEKPFDLLLVDLIDERHSVLEVEGSLVCNSVALKKFADSAGIDLAALSRQMSLDPRVVAETLALIPAFAGRLRSVLRERPAAIHEALWADRYVAADGTTRAFDDLRQIGRMNDVLRSYYDALRQAWPGVAVIRVPDELRVAAEGHRWGLQPFHYMDGYYRAFIDRLRDLAGDRRTNAA